VLTFFTASLWYRFRDASWRRTVQAGLMPVTAGLIMAGAALLARTTSAAWDTAALTVAALLLFLFTRLHPLLVLGAAAALGALGLVR
jgi:chromate transporter